MGDMMPRAFRNGLVYILLLVALAAFIFTSFSRTRSEIPEVSLSQVAQEVTKGAVERVAVKSSDLEITYKADASSPEALSRKEAEASLPDTLRNLGVPKEQIDQLNIEIVPPSRWENWGAIIGTLLPLILVGAFFFFLMRQAQGAGNQAFAFGKSKARMFTGDKPTVTFADVAGAEEAKEELREVVEFLKEPQKFAALGARIPKGVLLIGSPGTGKTLMAKAVSGEAGVPFFSISGSEFVEMFVGVGASRVRDLFEQAKRNSPAIIFIDEIDAVGRHRGAGLGGSHDEREQTLNQLLVEMDGFDTDTNVIIIAATNRPDILDPALLRPGRFDRQVVMDRPDMRGRKAILEVHVRGKPLAPDINLEALARQTPGFAGADLENMVNEAAILAARRNKRSIGNSEFEEAIERVVAGPERRSRLISDHEKKVIAYHEAGHAVVMHLLPNCDPVHKISIISRGMALGYTMPLPKEDRVLYSRDKYRDELAGLLGGRVAEEIIFEDVTTGASNDLARVTKMACQMVTQFGMSDKLGPLQFGHKEEMVFLGREISEQRNYSEEVAREIDHEVRGFIDEAYQRSTEILTTYRDKLTAVARRLIEIETMDTSEFIALVGPSAQAPTVASRAASTAA